MKRYIVFRYYQTDSNDNDDNYYLIACCASLGDAIDVIHACPSSGPFRIVSLDLNSVLNVHIVDNKLFIV